MKSLLIFILGVFSVTSVLAQSPDTLALNTPTQAEVEPSYTPEQAWSAANEAYIAGDFARAEELYGRIVADGKVSVKLYFNLANAYFKQNKLGEAILYYNRALRLSPGDEDVRYNLAIAESLTKDRIERVPEFFLKSWLRSVRMMFSCQTWTILSLIVLAVGLFFSLLFVLAQRLALRKTGFYGVLVMLLLFVATTWFAAAERRVLLDREEAVVMTSTASVKSSPDRSASDLFVLHEGTTLRVVGTLDSWSEVVIADGKKGWLESEKIEQI
jgi:tetratricopeptide (TPR) repeat protein